MSINPQQAYNVVVEADPEGQWSQRVLPGPDGVMVFPVDGVMVFPVDGDKQLVGEAPALVTATGVTFLPSDAEEWPSWFWRVCEDETAWVTVQ